MIAADETVDDDLFIGAETVMIDGTVNGDLYAAGGVVTVNGTINGDVLVAGGVVNISGIIGQDVRAAGGTIAVTNAQIADNVSVFGGNLTLDNQTTVGGTLVVGGGNAVSQAEVGRNVVGGAGALTIDNKVGGDIEVGAGQLTLGSQADVGGKVTYASEEEASIAAGASIAGEVKQILPQAAGALRDFDPGAARGFLRGVNFGVKLWLYLSALLVGIVTLYLFRKESQAVAENILAKPLASLGWGVVVLIVTVPVLALLLMTVIGIPLALILLGLYLLMIYLTKVFVGLLFGQVLFSYFDRKQANLYAVLAVGLAVYYLLTAIPFLGFFVATAAVIFGLGGLFICKKAWLAERK